MSKKITMKSIAEKANISIGTVDRALNNRPGINIETKKNILEVANQLGYKTNKIASALGRKKNISLAVVYSKEPTGFYKYVDKGIEKAQIELEDFGVNIVKIKTNILSPKEQNKIFEELSFSDYDGFAINSASLESDFIINKIIANNIPVITFNTDAPKSKRLFYVGTDSYTSGQIAGELMANFLCKEEQGTIIAMGNFKNSITFLERIKGFENIIKEKTNNLTFTIATECNSNPKIAEEILTQFVENNKNLKGIFLSGYSATVGAMEMMEKLNPKNLKVIGYDLNDKIIQGLNSGYCNAVLYQDPYNQGYKAVKFLAKHILENYIPKSEFLYIEPKIVLKSNLKYYL